VLNINTEGKFKMANKKDEISLRQLMLIYILLIGSPAIRLIPSYTAKAAKQASWVAPLVSLAVSLILILILQVLFNRYKNESLLDIVQNILGKYFATIINVVWFILITILAAIYVRYYSERMVTSLFPNTSTILFSCILLLVLALVLRAGLAIFARMNEIFLPVVITIYLVMSILVFPEVRIKNFYPITYKDILPIFSASMATTAMFGYVTLLFILGDKVKGKDKIKKLGFQSNFLLAFLLCLTILAPVGVFGADLVAKMNFPYFSAVKDISLFGIIERVEAGIIAIWILTDFSIIGSFLFAGLHIINWIFKSTTEKPFVNVYVIITFILSMYIANTSIELANLSNVLVYIILFFGIIVPVLLFVVGKIRKLI